MSPAATVPETDTDAAACRRPGRPRSERAEHAIIDAALDLFAESGMDGVSIEAVAARAGVGKTTIYRRWPGKEDLLLDALATLKRPLPEPAGVSVADDLTALLGAMSEDSADPRRMRAYLLALYGGGEHQKLRRRYLEEVVEPRREVLRTVLRRGVSNGELRADLDVDVALMMLIGALLSRGKMSNQPIPPDYAQQIVDEALRGLTPRP